MDMNSTSEKTNQIKKLISELQRDETSDYSTYGALIKSKEYVKSHIGEENEFFWAISSLEDGFAKEKLVALLVSLCQYIEDGLFTQLSPKEIAAQEIASETLSQALAMLKEDSNHPAAACFLAGATLENYLRSWAEREKISVQAPPSISKYAEALKKKKKITSQDVKDITSWAGLRNSAVHGNWREVEDKKRVELMVEGIGLFARKYSL